MIVDVSHLSDKGFWDIVEHGTRPLRPATPIAAHWHPTRNLTDEMIRALSERGGIAGLNYYAPFLDADPTHPENCRSTAAIAKHAAHYKQVGGAQMIALWQRFLMASMALTSWKMLRSCRCWRMPCAKRALLRTRWRGSISATPCAFEENL